MARTDRVQILLPGVLRLLPELGPGQGQGQVESSFGIAAPGDDCLLGGRRSQGKVEWLMRALPLSK